jgi:hypothetical protein
VLKSHKASDNSRLLQENQNHHSHSRLLLALAYWVQLIDFTVIINPFPDFDVFCGWRAGIRPEFFFLLVFHPVHEHHLEGD